MSSADSPADREQLDTLDFDALVYQFEDAWQAGHPPKLEEFLPSHLLARRELLEELVQIEWEYRLKAGESPSDDQYRQRFPDLFCGSDLADRLSAVKHELAQRPAQPASDHAGVAARCGPGEILGNYLILEPLGQGAVGFVYKAQHRAMKRMVALKVIVPKSDWTGESQKRFRREIETVAHLAHPNIVSGYDADEVDDVHYLAMELVDGIDLARLVRERGPLPVETAIGYVVQAAEGLEHAHRAGVVHRDVKPSNLIVNAEGTVKVLDLGMARWKVPSDSAASTLTRTGQVFGTIDFLAPEQALNSKNADGRADIYSLGCTLWFMLTGKLLYSGSLMQRVLAHCQQPIPSLCEANPDASPALAAVFTRMVAKSKDERYQSMAEVIAALRSLTPRPAQPKSTSFSLPNIRRWLLAVICSTVVLTGLAYWWSTLKDAVPNSAPSVGDAPKSP